jgi:hypothetical protein
MSRTVDGSSTIIASTRRICRMVGKYGTGGIISATSGHPAFAAAVVALVAACQVWEALDDFPGEVDQTPGGETD